MLATEQYIIPPGSRLPTVVQTPLYGLATVPYLEWCHRRYGDAFVVRLPRGVRMVVFADPADIKAVFALGADDFSAESSAELLAPFVGERSVLLMDGEHHKNERARLVKSLHGESTTAWATVMEQATRAELARWPTGEPFAVLPRLRSIALDVILRTVFGTQDAGLRRALDDWLDRVGSLLVLNPAFRRSFLGHTPWDRFVASRNAFDVELDRVIDASDASGTDVLSHLLRSEPPLDRADLRDALLTMVAAGHETTATATAWALDLLLHHPDALVPIGDDAWLDAVVKEVLRLHPVIEAVGRTVTRDTTIGRWRLPAGSTATASPLLAGRRYPDPDAFRPERFLDQPIDPTTWLPFGGGIRRCLGAAFATLEMKTMLRVLLTEATLRAAHGKMERPKRRAVTLAPARGTRVVLDARL